MLSVSVHKIKLERRQNAFPLAKRQLKAKSSETVPRKFQSRQARSAACFAEDSQIVADRFFFVVTKKPVSFNLHSGKCQDIRFLCLFFFNQSFVPLSNYCCCVSPLSLNCIDSSKLQKRKQSSCWEEGCNLSKAPKAFQLDS